jgi:hypothetical protein
MDNYIAVGIAEGFIDADDEEQFLEARQHLIDTGLVWHLQGSFGRTAINLINSGVCTYASDTKASDEA